MELVMNVVKLLIIVLNAQVQPHVLNARLAFIEFQLMANASASHIIGKMKHLFVKNVLWLDVKIAKILIPVSNVT